MAALIPQLAVPGGDRVSTWSSGEVPAQLAGRQVRQVGCVAMSNGLVPQADGCGTQRRCGAVLAALRALRGSPGSESWKHKTPAVSTRRTTPPSPSSPHKVTSLRPGQRLPRAHNEPESHLPCDAPSKPAGTTEEMRSHLKHSFPSALPPLVPWGKCSFHQPHQAGRLRLSKATFISHSFRALCPLTVIWP